MHYGARHHADHGLRACRCGRHGGQGERHAASCGCGCETHGWRRFQTKEEAVERLERYLQDLQKEAQAVEERIAALKAE
jgi:hypothetical protein